MNERKQKQIFDDWLSTHKGLFFKVVRAYAFDDHDREDLFQEISIQIWKSIPSFRGESSTATWIYRVALYAAMTWVRQEKRRPAQQALTGVEHILIQTNDPKDDRLDWLYEQIAQLNEIDRSLIILLLDGYSYKEMADIIGISISNVGVKISRIKKYLSEKTGEVV